MGLPLHGTHGQISKNQFVEGDRFEIIYSDREKKYDLSVKSLTEQDTMFKCVVFFDGYGILLEQFNHDILSANG